MHEAKTHLSKLVSRALAGEEIVIARAGKPAVRLQVEKTEQWQERNPNAVTSCFEGTNVAFDRFGNRVPGLMKGEFTIADDAFNPMTEEELALWYGE